MMETWKDIKGYKEHYQVSDEGNVRSRGFYTNGPNGSKRFIQPANLRPRYISGKYWVCLRGKYRRVDKLMFETFIGKPRTPVKYGYIDGNKFNTKLSNIKLIQIQG